MKRARLPNGQNIGSLGIYQLGLKVSEIRTTGVRGSEGNAAVIVGEARHNLENQDVSAIRTDLDINVWLPDNALFRDDRRIPPSRRGFHRLLCP